MTAQDNNTQTIQADAYVIKINGEVMTIQAAHDGIAFKKNEVVYVCPSKPGCEDERLKGEILRVRGNTADIQVFEETGGMAVGDTVIKTNELLSLNLGPGMLGQIYDGLQNPLEDIAQKHGFFLPRGVALPEVDINKKWAFTAMTEVGKTVRAGDVIGTVPEGRYTHKIFAPFDMNGEAEVEWIQEGNFTVNDVICRIKLQEGGTQDLTMMQRWPVRRSIPSKMLKDNTSDKLFPDTPLITTGRLIDTFFPIARGGTACTPGPFGSGKTVLQHGLSKFSEVDIVIVVACGERAGEVVETVVEFPELQDPKTGGSLMDRTIIVCNTSSMPVAAREASIYTGITLGEYYRQMGYDVLLLADSTSRWAQAMRETSGRLEEIPGEEAFPAYLDSAIKGLYERGGVVKNNDGSTGALTIVGAVSPAGGNFEEPVTQSTLRTVKCFLALSAGRANKRFYPAIEPLTSWSRYHDQLSGWFDDNIHPQWSVMVARMMDFLKSSESIYQMMQVTGEEGISMADFVTYQKGFLVDMVYLQQDAFDDVDVSCPIDRQVRMLDLLDDLLWRRYDFADKDGARTFFTRLTGLIRNLNYAADGSPQYDQYLGEVRDAVARASTDG